MLSFFRTTKLSEVPVENIINGTENLSVQSNQLSDNDQSQDPNTLLKSLGYKDTTDLRETIYGKFHNFPFPMTYRKPNKILL